MRRKVIIGGSLFNGRDNSLISNAVVIIENGRIAGVGREGEVEIPDESKADYYYAKDMTIIPGLIDTHTHIQLNPGENEFDSISKLVPLSALEAAANARDTLEAGFTTIRDLGALNLVDLAVRDAINQGTVVGPRMLVSGYKIIPTGADYIIYPPEVDIKGRETMDSPDEIRRAARRLLTIGVDVIKVMTSGRTFRKSSSPNARAYTLEEVKIAVDEAHNQGKKVSAHAHGSKGVKIALKAGCDTIEHGTVLDEEDIEFMVNNDIFLIPTFSYSKHVKELGRDSGLPSYSIEKALKSREKRLNSFNNAFKAGVKIAMGSDAGMPYTGHGDNAFEIQEMVNAGMSPFQALKASTTLAAEALDLSEDVGTIEEGKLADILIIDGNPLTDISILQDKEKIIKIFKEGCEVVSRN